MIYAQETARAPEQWINRSDAPILFRGKDTDDTEIKTDPLLYFLHIHAIHFDIASTPPVPNNSYHDPRIRAS